MDTLAFTELINILTTIESDKANTFIKRFNKELKSNHSTEVKVVPLWSPCDNGGKLPGTWSEYILQDFLKYLKTYGEIESFQVLTENRNIHYTIKYSKLESAIQLKTKKEFTINLLMVSPNLRVLVI